MTINYFHEVLSAFFLIIEYQKKYYTKLCLYNLVILGVPFISLCRIRFCNRNCNALRCIIIFIELAFVDFVLLVSSCHSQCYFCSLNMFVFDGYVSIGCYMILLGEAEALFGKPILHTSITTIHSLSQQGVWVYFGHPNPQRSLLRTPKYLYESYLEMSISSMQ